MDKMLETLREIESLADRALRDDDYRRGEYLGEIKHLAWSAASKAKPQAQNTKKAA